ncbi:MAG: AmmeMemoRadiSam system protein B [Propionivibrio sp.]
MQKDSRPAAVAGMFYPESARLLAGTVAGMLEQAAASPPLHPKAIIAPHAGYIYSGPIAASVYAPLAALHGIVRRVVLLGPTHRVAIKGLAIPTCATFTTPLGDVTVDHESVTRIADLPQIVASDEAHAQEHSLEVQLPFLQTVLGEFLLLPLAVGQASAEAVAEVLERVWGGDETLIVVSSDLSHYLSYDMACRNDSHAARQILDLDPTLNHQQACGATPVNGLLLAARRHQLLGKLLDLRNSGDTAGDKARVVGYGAFAFLESRTGALAHAY